MVTALAGVRWGLTVALAGVRGLTVLWPASPTVSGHGSSRCAAGPHCALVCVPHGEWSWLWLVCGASLCSGLRFSHGEWSLLWLVCGRASL